MSLGVLKREMDEVQFPKLFDHGNCFFQNLLGQRLCRAQFRKYCCSYKTRHKHVNSLPESAPKPASRGSPASLSMMFFKSWPCTVQRARFHSLIFTKGLASCKLRLIFAWGDQPRPSPGVIQVWSPHYEPISKTITIHQTIHSSPSYSSEFSCSIIFLSFGVLCLVT